MPEGPTIKNMAERLSTALVGHLITKVSSRYKKAAIEDWPSILQGRTIERVRSHGKNLFIDLSGGCTIYSHMVMWGSWHIYAPGEAWLKPEKLARLVLWTDKKVAVLFNAPLCEVLMAEQLKYHKTALLGPDLLAENFDKAQVWNTIQLVENRPRELGELLLDQNVLSGIGNILKSEILFRAGLHPKKRVESLEEAQFNDLIDYSRQLLESSYQKGMRNTFIPQAMRLEITSFGFVYRRRNRPCHLCLTPIEMIRQGELQRSSYFCPTCQPLKGPIIPFELRIKSNLPW